MIFLGTNYQNMQKDNYCPLCANNGQTELDNQEHLLQCKMLSAVFNIQDKKVRTKHKLHTFLINSQFNSTQLNLVKSDNDYWFIHHIPALREPYTRLTSTHPPQTFRALPDGLGQ